MEKRKKEKKKKRTTKERDKTRFAFPEGNTNACKAAKYFSKFRLWASIRFKLNAASEMFCTQHASRFVHENKHTMLDFCGVDGCRGLQINASSMQMLSCHLCCVHVMSELP